MTRYLTLDDMLAVHADQRAVEGVRDLGLVEAAVMRPQQSAFLDEAYPTLAAKGAALLESPCSQSRFP